MEMLHDRITLANTISTLEDDVQDDNYTTTMIDDNVLPVGAEEMGAGMLQSIASFTFLSFKVAQNSFQHFPRHSV